MTKKTKISVMLLLILSFLVAIDLGFLMPYGSDGYSVIRLLACKTIQRKKYEHISPNSNYTSSGDYIHIYQCGDEYDKKHPGGG